MHDAPHITEASIRALVGERSFQKARDSVAEGAIFDTRRQGMVLEGACEGSASKPYRVEATLGTKGVTRASCSCPIGRGGDCKHVAALLLTWLKTPGDFIEVEDLDASLERLRCHTPGTGHGA